MHKHAKRVRERQSTRFTLGLIVASLVTILASAPSALEDKELFGVWTYELPDRQTDTIRFKRKHFFHRTTSFYAELVVPKADGSQIVTKKLSRRVEDKGLWYVVDGRVRARFKRTVDGVSEPNEEDGSSGYHMIFLSPRDSALAIDEINGEAIPLEKQPIFQKSTSAKPKRKSQTK